MTLVIILYVAQVLILGIYALFCLTSTGWRRWAGPVGLGLVTLMSLYLGLQSLGRAKPYSLHLENLEHATVIGIDYVQDVAIYFFVRPEGWNEPFLVSVPWTDEGAAAANRKQKEAETSGEDLEIQGRGEGEDADDDTIVNKRKFRRPEQKQD